MIDVFETTIDARENHKIAGEVSTVYLYCDLDANVHTFPERIDEDDNPDLTLTAIVHVAHDIITPDTDEGIFLKIQKLANKVYEENIILIRSFNSIWED